MSRWKIGLALLSGLGCSSAYADRIGPSYRPGQALAIAPEKVRAPYDVTIVAGDGETLQTYARGGRYYIMGDAGDRYIIRVTNPTPNRVEAVVSVDGLDVIDGENGDLRKRGYVIQPYGELRVEGFRTSTQDVATFRFSSVSNSYAGRKGKARNVGVIAVAIFEEVPPPAPPQIIVPDDDGRYDYEDDLSPGTTLGGLSRGGGDRSTGKISKRPMPAPDSAPTTAEGGGGGGAPSRPAPPPHDIRDYNDDRDEECCTQTRKGRPGLGTEFGEQRYSAATYTRFVRAAQRPIAVAELRYNDAAGLIALGIPVQPIPDQGELSTRETADPFPGDNFARPPR